MPFAQAANESCVRFFEDDNFGGRQWSFFCDDPAPDYSWNDEITSMKVPNGYKLVGYQHAQYGGASKTFIGFVPNVGSDFNDLISSWKLVPFNSSKCVTAFEDENYSGESWVFCPPDSGLEPPPHSRWNDNISSFKLPSNNGSYKVKFCSDLDHDGAGNQVGRGFCRSYFTDMPFIGSFVNDKFSYIEYGPFNSDSFNMVIMSDPQYFFCESETCRSITNEFIPPFDENCGGDFVCLSINCSKSSRTHF